MRHPQKYSRAVNHTYTFTYLLDLSMAVIGLLMFGDGIRDEVTSNILKTPGFPHAISVCIVAFIAIIPLTKIPLNIRPIFVTIEVLSGLHTLPIMDSQGTNVYPSFLRNLLKGSVRTLLIVAITLLAILVPSFHTIMALMGSAMCFTICIVLPLSFYLKLFGSEISMKERVLDWFLISVCSILAIMGTVWVFLPRRLIGVA